jgi:hypothetical protein
LVAITLRRVLHHGDLLNCRNILPATNGVGNREIVDHGKRPWRRGEYFGGRAEWESPSFMRLLQRPLTRRHGAGRGEFPLRDPSIGCHNNRFHRRSPICGGVPRRPLRAPGGPRLTHGGAKAILAGPARLSRFCRRRRGRGRSCEAKERAPFNGRFNEKGELSP